MRFALLALALALSACVTQPPLYAPAAGPGRPGYTETRIEADRYRIVFRAAGQADASVLENFALRRAAEITRANSYDWFIVDHRRLEHMRREGPRAAIGVGGGSFGRRSGMSVGAAIGFPIGAGHDGARAALFDIRLGRGEKPDRGNAYDAREILGAMAPR